nr:MAG TPA: hypothetical protein [Caudoviricetes sp.]
MSAQLVWESRVLPLTRSKLITANDKMHWAARSRLTKQLRQWGYLLGREGEGVARLGLTHARVEMEFAYPDRRRRDRGKRRLAYDILKRSEGIYVVIDMTTTPEVALEINRRMGIDETILRTKLLRPDAH